MHKLAFLVITTATATFLAASTVVAASHLTGSFTFPGALCGFPGTVQIQFIDNFGAKADGSSWDAGQIHETFTADNGRGVTIDFANGHLENSPTVANPDGTTTLVRTYAGSQFKIQAVNGPVLQQNAGQLQVTVVRAADGSLISFSVVILAGPNPNTSGDENSPESCAVIAPYLAA